MRVEDYLRDNAERLDGKTALADGATRLSFAELDLMSERMAAALAGAGVVPGDRVLVFMDNSWKAIVSIFALLKAGAVFGTVDPAAPPERLADIVESCHAACLVTQSRLAATTADAMARTMSLRLVVIADCQGAPAIDGILRFEDAIAADGAAPDLASLGGSHPAMLRCSALNCGVLLTHDDLDATIARIAAVQGESGDPVIHCALPFTVDEGLYRILAAARLGAMLVLVKAAVGQGAAASSNGLVNLAATGGGDLPWAI